MDKDELDFKHATLLGTLKGTLSGPGDDSLLAARQALAWAMQAMGEEFNPHHKVKDSLSIGELLLQRDTKHFNPRFMQEWIERFGIQSVFPEASGTRLVSVWLTSLRNSLSSKYTSSASSTAPLLTWLLQRAPPYAVPLDPLPAVADQLEKQRKENGLEPAFENLLAEVSRLSASQVDPTRPPLRWLSSQVLLGQPLDLSISVKCPSGTTRTMRELALLRSVSSHNSRNSSRTIQDKPGSASTIPRLPHGRKADLARSWVLDPKLDTDTARARLWACADQKPEAIVQLLIWMRTPPRWNANAPKRIREIFQARDAFGRGLMAWLACSHNDENRYLAGSIASAMNLPADDIYSSDGAGLMEQLMIGRRTGHEDDAFHGRDVSRWAKESLDSEAIAGPIERRDAIVSDLVDITIPFGIQDNLVATMERATSDPRLACALAWSSFFSAIAHPPSAPDSYGQSGRNRNRQSTHVMEQAGRLGKKIDDLLGVVGSNLGALDIGVVEWRQWGPMFMEKCKSCDVDSRFANALTKRLPDLERVIQANGMHITVPNSSHARPSPRL